jgi:2-hydroxychromene-2-carboxylate isomerase
MTKAVEYFYTPVSPFTYLGARRFREICTRHGAEILHKPIDLGRVFPVSGGLPLAQRPQQRRDYRLTELKRWSDYLGLPMTLEPKHFPVPPHKAARLILAAISRGSDPTPLSEALFAAVWEQERNIDDFTTLAEIAVLQGLPAELAEEASADPAVEARYTALTEEAIEGGIFGAPTYRYRGELFWGQDRLEFLERALAEG